VTLDHRADRVPGAPPPALEWSARLGTVAAVLLAAYWKIVDCETYMRLAIGRATWAAHLRLGADPFIYSVPGLRWRNPEWLGDLLLWGVYNLGGEPGLVIFKLLVLGTGWLLLYELARRRGGSPLVVLGLALLVLGGSEWHLGERNEMHIHWLVPAYGLCLEGARRDRRWLWGLLPLGLLWANLHGSFPVGWIIVGAALAESLVGAQRDRRLAVGLALALLAHPLFPLASLDGLRAYDQVVDHLRYGREIKKYIVEWRPPAEAAATLSQLPLHALGLIGLASFLPRPNRRQVAGFLLFLTGLALAHGSQRFLLLFGLLAIPVVAGNLRRFASALAWPQLASGRSRIPARAGAAALLALGSVLFTPAVLAARRCPAARDQLGFPVAASRFVAAHAPEGSRLFMPYTGGQWLMWNAPRVPLYIEPNFTFSTRHFLHFFQEVMPHPDRFEEEVRRLDVNLALVDLVGESAALHRHLDRAPGWALVYFDGFYALYAARVPRNEGLIAASAYTVIRARLSFDELAAASEAALAPELARLDAEAPAVAAALHAFRLLRSSAPDGRRAGALLATALPVLPSSPALIAYRIEAAALAGDRAAAQAALAQGLRLFPQSARLQALVGPLRGP
jgi:hypothetical protein